MSKVVYEEVTLADAVKGGTCKFRYSLDSRAEQTSAPKPSRRAIELMHVVALAGALPGGAYLGGGTLVHGFRGCSIPEPARPGLPPVAAKPQPGPMKGKRKLSRAERKRLRARGRT